MAADRLNRLLLNFAIVVILAGAAVVGILLAVGNSENEFHPSSPTVTTQGQLSASASGNPLPTIGGGTSGGVQTKTIAVSPGSGWKIKGKGTFFVDLLDPKQLGILGFESGPLKNPNLVNYANSIIDDYLKGTTGGKVCGTVNKGNVVNGPPGIGIPLCYTIVPQSGKAIKVFTILLVGVGGKGIGTVIAYTTVDSESVINTFLGESAPVARTVRWKLLSSGL